MVIKNAELETVVGVTTRGFPKHSIPEVAFAGRSNVGKSSLINCLLNRKSLARTSSTPGKTQTINFYRISGTIKGPASISDRTFAGAEGMTGEERSPGSFPSLGPEGNKIDKELYFVDLPGYGYAKVSLDFKKQWAPMIERYLKKAPTLKNIFLLVDMRRPPTADDMIMYDWVRNAGFDPIVIATKADKLKKSQFKDALKAVEEAYGADRPDIITFSAVTRSGKDEVWKRIESVCFEG